MGDARSSPVLSEGIDRGQLERWAAGDLAPHAFALFDLEHFPSQVRFVSLVRDGELQAYLLIWYGDPAKPVVHWVGTAEPELLARGLPRRPLVLLAPDEVLPSARRALGPGEEHPIEFLLHQRPAAGNETPPALPAGVDVRRLRTSDTAVLTAFRERHREDPAAGVSNFPDVERSCVVAALERGPPTRLVATARAVVQLPTFWVIGGVYTEPDLRGLGLARAVLRTVLEEARRAGADCGLFVRSENRSALAAYRDVGFVPHFRRIWFDAGGGPPP